jgi:hypothetical protein
VVEAVVTDVDSDYGRLTRAHRFDLDLHYVSYMSVGIGQLLFVSPDYIGPVCYHAQAAAAESEVVEVAAAAAEDRLEVRARMAKLVDRRYQQYLSAHCHA